MNRYCCVLLAAIALIAQAASKPTLAPADLRCDGQVNPLAVHDPAPRLSWILYPAAGAGRGLRQSAYRILVASSPEALANDHGDLWDSGKTVSAQTVYRPYGGKPLASGMAYFWKVRIWDTAGSASPWSTPAQWTMGLLRQDDWGAKWIAQQPDGEPAPAAMPIFRRSFRLEKPVRRATLYISGLGEYEARLNGAMVGDAVVAPGWTKYRKTVFYNTFDVTTMLHAGDNVIGAFLGNGMYNVVKTPGRYTKFVGSFGQPKMMALLRVTYQGGSTFDLGSDRTWRVKAGPITYSSTYGGEDFDARLEAQGWERAGFKEEDWDAAIEVAGPGGALSAQTSPDIKVIAVFKPVKVSEPRPGVLVYDLGQNFSGWPRITVRGPAGSALRVFCGELLGKDGLPSQASSGGNERNGYHWYTYTLKGSETETWRPRFSYYGFRYVQVEGAATKQAPGTGKPEVVSLEGQFTHSSAAVVGEFSCSKPLFNQIHTLINAAIRSNMQSVLTDCPHREKWGWLEETHLLGSAILFNYDATRLYGKISGDMRDSQTPTGLVPDTAPDYSISRGGFRDSPEWGSAAVLNPWIVYRHTGDRRLLEQHYDVMTRYVDYLSGKATGHILSYGLGDWYDIGPKPPGVSQLTSLGLTATAVYYTDLVALRDAAKLLNKTEDAGRFDALSGQVRAAFNAKLLNPATGVYDRGSQTAQAMPLVIGLAPEDKRGQVLDRLVEAVRANGNRVTAGDIGFHYVVRALSDGGRSDVLYDMLARSDGPSYAYQLRQGATTLTEAWDAGPASSQNHFMLGHAEEWFYRGLAGLDLDFTRAPGERIRIRPNVVGDITSARARYRSVGGEIVSDWKVEGGTFHLRAIVPPNTTATVYVPTAAPDSVTEGGRPAAKSPGVRFVTAENGVAAFQVESGTYQFRARAPAVR